jgi:hypothetical protein
MGSQISRLGGQRTPNQTPPQNQPQQNQPQQNQPPQNQPPQYPAIGDLDLNYVANLTTLTLPNNQAPNPAPHHPNTRPSKTNSEPTR